MSANYFLFATLESARQIAHGRVPQDGNRPPVLTGTPVAGMVYLERPRPAGYFIFPDLSVRHEGKYRLSFNLYEELKEDKDEDRIDEDIDSAKARGLGDAHVQQRLEVKSQPFTVWSAKKFPGLGMSTDLSRVVAEQGCRVRIRRDVRMRRRADGKEGQSAYENEPRTPDAYGQHRYPPENGRRRSTSVSSHVSLAPAIPSRRSSGEQLSQGYQQPAYPQSAAPQYAYGQAPYAPQPHHQYPAYGPPASIPPPTAQPMPASSQAPLQPYGFPPSAPPNAQQYYNYPQAVPQNDGTIQHRHSYPEQGHQYSADMRRASMQAPPYSGLTAHYPSREVASYATPAAHQPPPSTMEPPQQNAYKRPGPILPPLNTSVPDPKLLEPSPTSAGPVSFYHSSYTRPTETSQPVPPPPTVTPYNQSSEAYSTKRSYDTSFNPHHYQESLRHGARPTNEQGAAVAYGDHPAETEFRYPRADGGEGRRLYYK